MKRNPVAWAALIVASAALVSSSGFLRPMPAAPKVPVEGQQAAKALSQAFEAVAEFVRPSVVQITVQKKIGGHAQYPRHARVSSSRPAATATATRIRSRATSKRCCASSSTPKAAPEQEQFGFRNTGSARDSSMTITVTS